MMRFSLKSVFMFVVFFVIFYFETISIIGVSIAVLWKTVLLALLAVVIFLKSKDLKINRLTLWGVVFSLAGLFNASLFDDAVATVSMVIKNAYIPILFGFLIIWVRSGADRIFDAYNFLIFTAIFASLSTIPFHLNILSPLSAGYDVSIFQLDGAGFVGVFQNSPVASVTLGVSSLILFVHLAHVSSLPRFLFYLLLLLISVFSCIQTLSRTGVSIFIVGTVVLMIMSRRTVHLIIGSLLFFAGIAGAIYLFESSELFRMRLLGLNSYVIAAASVQDQLGSGRLTFWSAALANFINSGPLEQLFGVGPTIAMDKMHESVGQRIYAHNGFIDVLQFSGFFGFAFYLIYFYKIYQVVRMSGRQKGLRDLLYILFLAYILQNFLQGERAFLVDLMFSIALVLSHASFSVNKLTFSAAAYKN